MRKWQSTQVVFNPAVSAIAKFDGFFGGHGRKADDDDDGVNGEIIYLQAKHPPRSAPFSVPPSSVSHLNPAAAVKPCFWAEWGERERERLFLSLL